MPGGRPKRKVYPIRKDAFRTSALPRYTLRGHSAFSSAASSLLVVMGPMPHGTVRPVAGHTDGVRGEGRVRLGARHPVGAMMSIVETVEVPREVARLRRQFADRIVALDEATWGEASWCLGLAGPRRARPPCTEC